MKHWDPIGVASVPECADEYDDYVPEIYRMLAKGRSPKELLYYLWWLETSYMGLAGTPKARRKTEAFAEILCKISVSTGAPNARSLSNMRRACGELALGIVTPFELVTDCGTEIKAVALLPQLGAPNGMLIFHDSSELLGCETVLVEMGYGYSVLGGGGVDEFDLESYKDMFRDWGWGRPEDPTAPSWIASEGLT